ncbi:MAG: ATP-binding protein [Ferroplasma sp.]|uniref:helicase HerA domain-containing protein n=1 Tax=Ferroplasma sp. TaxID=2591003 RepID=UPI0028160265|nr:DUF87 domain-containing protein [Ferroplasma sp.]WMT50922.1 MAG: ATP-binding protein [Ferroplasma sp.]
MPANVYNFKSYIYGLPLEKFIIIIAGISIIATVFTISLLAALIIGVTYFTIMLILRFDPGNVYLMRKLYFHGSTYEIKFIQNGELYGISGKFAFTALEIENRELYTDSAKNVKILGIARALEKLTCGYTIVSKPEEHENSIYYRTFVLLKANAGNFNSAVDTIRENITAFISGGGVGARLVDDEDTVSSIFPRNVRTFSNYFKKDGFYGSCYDIVDMDYSGDYLYQSIIEKFGFMVELYIDVKPLMRNNLFMKRLIASRKAELSYAKTGHYASLLKKQLSSLEALSRQDKLYNVSIRFSLLSDHPAELRKSSDQFLRVMESTGFKINQFHFFGRDSFDPLAYSSQGKKYMMDAESLSSIFPCGFTAIPESRMQPVGTNIITGKTVYLNLFRGSSYNIAITGETGSGKSYFTEMLLGSLGNSSQVYIIDPLMEYTGDQIVQLGSGEYPDFIMGTTGINHAVKDAIEAITGIPDEKVTIIIENAEKKYGDLLFSNLISEIINYEKRHSITFTSLAGKIFETPVKLSGKRVVFRFDYANSHLRDMFFRLCLTLAVHLAEGSEGNKFIVIDESHLFLKDKKNAEIVDMLARNGRHNMISLITVTQNVDDYYLNNYSESILRNSMNYFIFRQREKIKNKLFLGYNIDPSALAGGSNFDYSECFYSTGTLIRKLKIIGDLGNYK